MGYWLLMLIFIFISSLVIDNWFDTLRQKIPYYLGVAAIFCAFVVWSIHDWQTHTLNNYELTQSYLVFNYLDGKQEHIAYQDIENIKFFVQSKTPNCGLSFYIKGKNNIRTLSDFKCDDIRTLQNQINQKR